VRGPSFFWTSGLGRDFVLDAGGPVSFWLDARALGELSPSVLSAEARLRFPRFQILGIRRKG